MSKTARTLTRSFSSRPSRGGREAVIVSYARTPIGKMGGSLSAIPAPKLAAQAIKGALSQCGGGDIASQIQEAILGNVVSANIGQAPARQAVLYAGLSESVACTTVNKVCASGMKSVMLASQSIWLGLRDVVLAGGFESMSNVPYYLPGARTGYRLGDNSVVDGVIKDGLWDPYSNSHMGLCGEACAAKYGFTREDQDNYAIGTHRRAAAARDSGKFDGEITPVTVPGKRGQKTTVSADEQYAAFDAEKMRTLKPAFKKDHGTVTAANASALNDGAAALVLMSAERASALGLKPLARVLGVADAERAPVEFTIAPSDAVPLAIKHAGLAASDVDFYEINEAFAVVAMANMKLLRLDPERLNVNGGAVVLGHPIGMSGARLVGTLARILQQNDATIGCASICNGGGGASAVVIERLS